MKRFSEMNIEVELKSFTGDKIKIEKILNKDIIIHDYDIRESKYKEKGNGQCLHLQLEIGGEKRVLFSGSTYLMDLIKKVNDDDFPFITTIVKEGEYFKFT